MSSAASTPLRGLAISVVLSTRGPAASLPVTTMRSGILRSIAAILRASRAWRRASCASMRQAASLARFGKPHIDAVIQPQVPSAVPTTRMTASTLPPRSGSVASVAKSCLTERSARAPTINGNPAKRWRSRSVSTAPRFVDQGQGAVALPQREGPPFDDLDRQGPRAGDARPPPFRSRPCAPGGANRRRVGGENRRADPKPCFGEDRLARDVAVAGDADLADEQTEIGRKPRRRPRGHRRHSRARGRTARARPRPRKRARGRPRQTARPRAPRARERRALGGLVTRSNPVVYPSHRACSTIQLTRVGKSMPAWAASSGTSDIGVMPGRVLISSRWTASGPAGGVVVTQIGPRHAAAAERLVGGERVAHRPRVDRLGQRARGSGARPPLRCIWPRSRRTRPSGGSRSRPAHARPSPRR